MAGTSIRRREKKFSKKLQRSLDPAMLLSRGLSARFIGANVMQAITALSKDEMEKDLRHMNAYYQANVAYAQQHYIYMNREELEHYHNAQPHSSPIAMPVRIDPEEEKRLQNLRKKIALCETQREFLESQYVSLRAHYVATTKELAAASKKSEGLVVFLQILAKRRGRVLSLYRARLQIAREVLACLETRLECLGGKSAITDLDKTGLDDEAKEDDMVKVWDEGDEMLKEAELACRKIPCTLATSEKKSRKKSKKGAPHLEGEDELLNGVISWEAIEMPNTPEGVPLYLSQLATVPDKGVAFATCGVFGSIKCTMTWLEQSLPKSYDPARCQDKVLQLKDEVAFLEEELVKERQANKDIQTGIIGRRKRSDEFVAMMTLLRSETEAMLQRHNILLDSPHAKRAARELHEDAIRNRVKVAQMSGDAEEGSSRLVGEAKAGSPDKASSTTKEENVDNENDGDDEGDGYEEEGEIRGEWGSTGGKRELGEAVEESPANRKRRKL